MRKPEEKVFFFTKTNTITSVNQTQSITWWPVFIFKHLKLRQPSFSKNQYSKTSIHRFRRGSEKRNNGSGKTIDAGAIVEIGFAQGP
jgi:hypothetical protein